MGQKTNPIGNRLGIIRGWESNWFGGRNFGDKLSEDKKIRDYIFARLNKASVSRVIVERTLKLITITISTARPGIIIGKKGEEIENLKRQIKKIVNLPTKVNIKEIRKPDLDATILAESVAQQLERRVQFRRAMKRAVQSALRQSAKGVRVEISGRLNGAEIARTEWYREGRVPLHTLRADVDYGTAEALTTYGIIGVKVWVYKGEIIGDPIKEGVST